MVPSGPRDADSPAASRKVNKRLARERQAQICQRFFIIFFKFV